MIEPTITLTQLDYYRLNSILERLSAPFKEAEVLEEELDRARLVDFPEVPTDLVTMHTRFKYLVVNENKECEMTLVYPHEADSQKKWVSIFAPLGAALLGLREGDEIDWTFPDGKTKTLRILEVLYQPEANQDLHL